MAEICLVEERVVHHTFYEIFVQATPLLVMMTVWRLVLGYIVVNCSRSRWIKRNKDIPKLLRDDKYKINISVLQQTYQKELMKYESNKIEGRSKVEYNNDTPVNGPKGFILQVQNNAELIPMLSRELNMSSNDIMEYWRYLRKLDKIEKNLKKYNEEIWKCVTMTCITIFGIYVMCHEAFFDDPRLLFRQYPQQESRLIQLYYQISLGYHGFRATCQFFEPKRKDFWAMVIHHWVTVVLIVASWWTGVMQIGALVMVCHDNADIFLPAAKIARYEKNVFFTNILFALFLLCWIMSRIGLFSWKVVYPVLFEAYPTYTCNTYYGFFAALLCVLLLLHFYWLRMILRIAYTALFVSKVVNDNRSESSDNDM